MSIRPLFWTRRTSGRYFALFFVAAFPLACTSLTSPPEPVEISGESPAAAPPTSTVSAAFKGPMPSSSIATPPPPEGKLEVAETAPGKGSPAKAGDTVAVNYVGRLTDGKEFDRSKGKPFTFKLGAGNVIKGWDQGLLGMKPGSKRKLTIPPSLAYGARGYPPVIPPNSTLVFDVEMVEIKSGQ